MLASGIARGEMVLFPNTKGYSPSKVHVVEQSSLNLLRKVVKESVEHFARVMRVAVTWQRDGHQGLKISTWKAPPRSQHPHSMAPSGGIRCPSLKQQLPADLTLGYVQLRTYATFLPCDPQPLRLLSTPLTRGLCIDSPQYCPNLYLPDPAVADYGLLCSVCCWPLRLLAPYITMGAT